MYMLHFIISSDRHMDCFYLLTIVNNAAMNMGLSVSVLVLVLNFGGIYT